MASFYSNVAHHTSLMLTATAQSRRMVIVCICFLLLASGISAHSQVKELQSCGKEELVVYVHREDGAMVTAASPSGNDIQEFGTIYVIDNGLRNGFANDSTPVGRLRGLLIFEKDLSISAVFTYELTAPGCTGSLTARGSVDRRGNGEIVITGGTGTFRWARGYTVNQLLPASADPTDPSVYVVFKDTLHLKYF